MESSHQEHDLRWDSNEEREEEETKDEEANPVSLIPAVITVEAGRLRKESSGRQYFPDKWLTGRRVCPSFPWIGILVRVDWLFFPDSTVIGTKFGDKVFDATEDLEEEACCERIETIDVSDSFIFLRNLLDITDYCDTDA